MNLNTSRIGISALLALVVATTALAAPPMPPSEPVEPSSWQAYDAGRLRVLASAESAGGRFAVLELHEQPGYKTPPHRHPDMDETFYVLEGTLELRIHGKIHRLGPGSFAHVPRNTPHAQGSADDKPVRVLVTVTPGEFEAFFLDRVALATSTPRGHPDFQRAYLEIIRKHARWLQPATLETPPVAP